jgi:hypothetical protein
MFVHHQFVSYVNFVRIKVSSHGLSGRSELHLIRIAISSEIQAEGRFTQMVFAILTRAGAGTTKYSASLIATDSVTGTAFAPGKSTALYIR